MKVLNVDQMAINQLETHLTKLHSNTLYFSLAPQYLDWRQLDHIPHQSADGANTCKSYTDLSLFSSSEISGRRQDL